MEHQFKEDDHAKCGDRSVKILRIKGEEAQVEGYDGAKFIITVSLRDLKPISPANFRKQFLKTFDEIALKPTNTKLMKPDPDKSPTK